MATTTRTKPSLLEEVRASSVVPYHGIKPWHQRLSPEHVAEVEEIRQAWKSGQLSGPLRTIARAISATLRDRGIANIGEQGVQEWLRRG